MTEPVSAALIGAERQRELDPDEVDRIIERRARQGESDPVESEPSYQESVRQYRNEIQEANRHAWCSYYRRLAKSFRQ